jgi:hypothetical protein
MHEQRSNPGRYQHLEEVFNGASSVCCHIKDNWCMFLLQVIGPCMAIRA